MNENRRSEILGFSALAIVTVAEEGSFTAAADRLGLTQSAVSHRIKTVEEVTGITVFTRTTRRVVPTPEGSILVEAARQCLHSIHSAFSDIDRLNRAGPAILSVSSSVATRWLIPRLWKFTDGQDGFEVAIDATDRATDLTGGDADMALRFTARPPPGVHATFLGHDRMVAVQAFNRGGASGVAPLHETGILLDTTAESDGTVPGWADWAAAVDIDLSDIPVRQRFNRADLMLQATTAGQGAALSRWLLIADDAKAGVLCVLDGPTLTTRAGYWLLARHDFARSERFLRFAGWLEKEIGATLGKTG